MALSHPTGSPAVRAQLTAAVGKRPERCPSHTSGGLWACAEMTCHLRSRLGSPTQGQVVQDSRLRWLQSPPPCRRTQQGDSRPIPSVLPQLCRTKVRGRVSDKLTGPAQLWATVSHQSHTLCRRAKGQLSPLCFSFLSLLSTPHPPSNTQARSTARESGRPPPCRQDACVSAHGTSAPGPRPHVPHLPSPMGQDVRQETQPSGARPTFQNLPQPGASFPEPAPVWRGQGTALPIRVTQGRDTHTHTYIQTHTRMVAPWGRLPRGVPVLTTSSRGGRVGVLGSVSPDTQEVQAYLRDCHQVSFFRWGN